jgi:hypothetical protein
MGELQKVNGILTAELQKYNGIAIADIAQINGQDVVTGAPGIPAGGIIPLRSTGGVPSGWTIFTAANGDHIIGAGSTYAADDNGAGTGALRPTSSSNGGHTIGSANFRHDSSGAAGTSSEPSHPHIITSTPNPDFYNQYMRLIKANSELEEFPSMGIIFIHTASLPGAMSRDDPGIARMFLAHTTDAVGGNNLTPHTMDSRWGNHCHGCIRGDDGDGSGGSQWKSGYPADHTHTMTVAWTNNLRKVALSMWYKSGASIPVVDVTPGNPIIMYQGAVAPDGWVLCNGSNGTPDMRNRFINCVGNGDAAPGTAHGNGTVQGVGTSTSVGDHDHDNGDKCGNCDDASGYHSIIDGAHQHTGTRSALTWLPPYYALTFIMYTG